MPPNDWNDALARYWEYQGDYGDEHYMTREARRDLAAIVHRDRELEKAYGPVYEYKSKRRKKGRMQRGY